MKNNARDRLRSFLKKAGGPTKVSEKTGISPATISNLTRGRSDPSFRVSSAILETYPALNARWWFSGGNEPMWIDNPKNIDHDLVDYIEESKPNYSTIEKQDYSSFDKAQLIQLLEEKDSILNALIRGKNNSLYVQNEQLSTLKKILEKIETQGATSQDTKK